MLEAWTGQDKPIFGGDTSLLRTGMFILMVVSKRLFFLQPYLGDMIQFDSYLFKWVETTN